MGTLAFALTPDPAKTCFPARIWEREGRTLAGSESIRARRCRKLAAKQREIVGADRGACRLRSSSAGLQARPKTSGRGAGRSQVLIDGKELRCTSDRTPLLCLKPGTYGGALGILNALCLAGCEKRGLTGQLAHPAGQSCPAALGRTARMPAKHPQPQLAPHLQKLSSRLSSAFSGQFKDTQPLVQRGAAAGLAGDRPPLAEPVNRFQGCELHGQALPRTEGFCIAEVQSTGFIFRFSEGRSQAREG